jgi:WD40 repeat protein
VLGIEDLDAVQIDLASGKELRRLRDCYASSLMTFSPDGQTLAIGHWPGNAISQWDWATGRRLAASADPSASFMEFQFDLRGNLLCRSFEILTTYHWASGRELSRLKLTPLRTRAEWFSLAPDQTRILVYNASGKPAVWDFGTGKQLWELPAGYLSFSRFSPDGKTIYSSRANEVRAFDAGTGKALRGLKADAERVLEPHISPDGHWLAAVAITPSGHGSLFVWDLRSSALAHRMNLEPGSAVSCDIAISSAGAFLALVSSWFPPTKARELSPGRLILWDLRNGEQQIAHWNLPYHVNKVTFSLDGRMLATGDMEGGVRLWETITGKERHAFVGHTMSVEHLAF